MLIFGNVRCIEFVPYNINIESGGMLIYNLTSASEMYPSVAILPHRISPGDDFENMLFQHIFGNDDVFMEWMSKIIMPLYYNTDVYLVCNDNQLFDFVTDSVSSIIRKRYGYNSYILNDPDDVFFLSEQVDGEGEFGILGLGNLYADKERYSYIYQVRNGTDYGAE